MPDDDNDEITSVYMFVLVRRGKDRCDAPPTDLSLLNEQITSDLRPVTAVDGLPAVAGPSVDDSMLLIQITDHAAEPTITKTLAQVCSSDGKRKRQRRPCCRQRIDAGASTGTRHVIDDVAERLTPCFCGEPSST